MINRGNNLGCCNMVLWDFLIIAVVAGMGTKQYFQIHPFYCLVIGLVTAVIIIALMHVRYIGVLLQMACGIFWSQAFFQIGYSFHPTDDPTWYWGMQIVLAVICVILHFVSTNEILGPRRDADYQYDDLEDQDEYLDSYRMAELYSDDEELQERFDDLLDDFYVAGDDRTEIMEEAQSLLDMDGTDTLFRLMKSNDEIWSGGVTKMGVYIDLLTSTATAREQRNILKKAERLLAEMTSINNGVLKESNHVLSGRHIDTHEEKDYDCHDEDRHSQNSSSESTSSRQGDIEESLFAGCRDKESLQKRYKNLMKTFHPDNQDGDTNMTMKIQSTYQYLLKRYE